MQDVVLHLGDCLEFMRTLEDGAVDAVVTDPPYGIGYDQSKSGNAGKPRFGMLQGDDTPFDISPFLMFPDILAWLRPQCTTGIPIGMGAWYVWDKVTRNSLDVHIGECEFAWHKRATKPRVFRHLWSGAYRDSENGIASEHPTQKPIAVMAWCLDVLRIPKGSTVFDPFMGSGTTGVACVRTGRKFIGCEIDAGYFAIAQRRIAEAQLQPPLFPHEPQPQAQQLPLDTAHQS